MFKVFKKNRRQTIFTIFIIALITSASFYYLNMTDGKPSNALLRDIQKNAPPELQVRVLQGEQSFWIADDGYMVGVMDDEGLMSYYNNPIVSSEIIKKIEDLTQDAELTFLSAGFTVDKSNSFESAYSAPFYIARIAFKNQAGELCLVESSPTGLPPWYLHCISEGKLSEAYTMQLPFLHALGDPKEVAAIPKQQGNYANVKVTNGQGGYYAIMKKSGDQWLVVFKGQDTPSCDLMNQNDIPRSIYEQCN